MCMMSLEERSMKLDRWEKDHRGKKLRMISLGERDDACKLRRAPDCTHHIDHLADIIGKTHVQEQMKMQILDSAHAVDRQSWRYPHQD